jgi:hypothetical protein
LSIDLGAHDRPWRHPHDHIAAVAAVLTCAPAVTATLGGEAPALLEGQQRIEMRVGQHIDVSAAPTVAAVRTTARDILLTPEGGRAVAAVAGLDGDMRAIVEFTSHKLQISSYMIQATSYNIQLALPAHSLSNSIPQSAPSTKKCQRKDAPTSAGISLDVTLHKDTPSRGAGQPRTKKE